GPDTAGPDTAGLDTADAAAAPSSVAVTSGEVAPEQTVAQAAGPEGTAAAEATATDTQTEG
ncbi:MAG TPA: 30S ribosomal protein S3, partial [Geodermatophilus sp.]|nr:30S ribosomal protein S3 [Geodermatophilus sp.]